MPLSTTFRLLVSTVSLAVLSIYAVSATEQSPDPAAQAAKVLAERCARCHGQDGAALKNVFVLDRDRLIASRVVVPGNPDSLLLKMVESNAMPPEGPALADSEKKILRDWVMAGAPKWDHTSSANRQFIDEQKLVAFINQDLLNQPQRSRPFLRYFSLAHLYNAGVSANDLETYRAALGKLINSLSWHKEITRPTVVDAARTVFRIDLRDYNWTAATWDLLLSAYPYEQRGHSSGGDQREGDRIRWESRGA